MVEHGITLAVLIVCINGMLLIFTTPLLIVGILAIMTYYMLHATIHMELENE